MCNLNILSVSQIHVDLPVSSLCETAEVVEFLSSRAVNMQIEFLRVFFF